MSHLGSVRQCQTLDAMQGQHLVAIQRQVPSNEHFDTPAALELGPRLFLTSALAPPARLVFVLLCLAHNVDHRSHYAYEETCLPKVYPLLFLDQV